MPRRVAISNLNARTIDILNVIRQNASTEYQSLVPAVTTTQDIPKVGEALFGYPALANQFLSALVNRIALVRIKSATFNNAYAELKKGYLENGETVEEVFVNIAKAREFSVEKAEAREFKRTIPDVRSAFHTMNWRVQYPVTIQDVDLKLAFTSMEGVTDLIAKIVDSVTTASEYDEYLLFKYLIIKAVAHGKMYPVAVDTSDMKNSAKAFRGMSNQLTFMGTKYNMTGVHTTTPKEDQYIFMDSQYNASYDVDVLASAFNMDKATFMGKLKLIDSFDTFDNDRFDVIRANSTMVEAVTDAELNLMKDVKAVLVDKEWFQVYDNYTAFTEKYVASGLYWNYFLNIWKTVSSSPFSNAIVFVANTADTVLPDTLTGKVTAVDGSDIATIVTVTLNEATTLENRQVNFVQTQANTQAGVAVHKYGAIIYPENAEAQYVQIDVGGVKYTSSGTVGTTADVGDTVTFVRDDYVASTLSALSITNVTLTPSFASGTLTYTGATSNASGTLTATKSDSDATVVVKMNGTVVEGTSLSFASGAGNVLTIDVTGVSEGSAVTKQYKVTITRS